MRCVGFSLLLLLLADPSKAQNPPAIIARNAQSIVYLQVEDAKGGVLDRGTGFIVSSDGFVITVAHLKVEPSQKMTGVIGKRKGTSVSLAFIRSDDEHDVALWKLPQSASGYQSVPLTDAPISVLDSGIVLGFPTIEDLSASRVSIRNGSSVRGFYKSDGYLQHGNSGGPMLNVNEDVIAMVQGGTLPGTDDNDLIPILFAIDLIKKNHVAASIHSPQVTSCVIPPSFAPPPSADYDKKFHEHQNELELSKLGQQAFAKGDYLWAIKFLEQAQVIQSSKVWESTFPYLATARLLANKDQKSFQCTLQDMLAEMRVNNSYLHHSTTIGFVINNLSDVRHYVDPASQAYIDQVISRATDIKRTLVN